MIYFYLLARQYMFFFFSFLSYLDLTVVQLNTVAFLGTIADRCDQETEFAYIHKQKK